MDIIIRSIPVWAEFISLCIGTLMCRAWVLSAAVLFVIPDRSSLMRRMWFFFGIAIAVILAGSAADLISRYSGNERQAGRGRITSYSRRYSADSFRMDMDCPHRGINPGRAPDNGQQTP